jgi:electron transfer flavoprotein beta subunit
MGKQSIDGDNNQTGQLLAGMLSWPQATFASAIAFTDMKLTVSREVDSGIENVNVPLPAVVTTDLRLNEPRFASLPNLMKAKKKTLEIVDLDSLGVDVSPRVRVVSVEDPPVRKGGKKVANVDELISALRNEAKVL